MTQEKPDYLSCGDDYLDCGDDYLDCGDDYLDCGDDVIPPDVPPVQEPRKDNFFAELFYKAIILVNKAVTWFSNLLTRIFGRY